MVFGADVNCAFGAFKFHPFHRRNQGGGRGVTAGGLDGFHQQDGRVHRVGIEQIGWDGVAGKGFFDQPVVDFVVG